MYVMASQMTARAVGTGQDILRKNGTHARLHGDTGFFAGNYLDNLVKESPLPPCLKLRAASGRPGSLRTHQQGNPPAGLAAESEHWRLGQLGGGGPYHSRMNECTP
jgi:hypothetical protein